MVALRRLSGLWATGGLVALLAGCPTPQPGTAEGAASPARASGTPVPGKAAPEPIWQCLVVGDDGLRLLPATAGAEALPAPALKEGEGPGAQESFAAAVTADGRWAAFSNTAGGLTLLEAATWRTVTATPGTLADDGRMPSLAWSPPGDALACVRGGDLYLVSLDGIARRMTTTGDVTGVCWSPDGKTLAYGRRDKMDKDLGLWSQAACGSKPVCLVPSTGDIWAASFPQWSPDGKWIAFVQAWEGGGLGFVSADGETRRTGVDTAWFPLLWLGDSSALVYDGSSPEGPVRGLCTCTPNGKPQVLAKGLIVGYDMLPDGRIVAARLPEGDDEGDMTVLLTDTRQAGAEPEALGTVKRMAMPKVLWRPDGGGFVMQGEVYSGDPQGASRWLAYTGATDQPPTHAVEGVRDVIGWVKAPAR